MDFSITLCDAVIWDSGKSGGWKLTTNYETRVLVDACLVMVSGIRCVREDRSLFVELLEWEISESPDQEVMPSISLIMLMPYRVRIHFHS